MMEGALDLKRGPIPAWLIRSTGRSWWQVRYAGGRVISEWETIPSLILRQGRTSRWEELDKRGLRGVRLLCPSGMAAELETDSDYKLFQLKTGGFQIGRGHFTNAHLIGVILNAEGDCRCFAWDYGEDRLIGPFDDSVLNMRYRQIGPLGLANLELRL